MNEKKLRKSPVTIILFVLAAIMLIYALYLVGSTIAYIVNYYAQYGMSPQLGESVGYVLQSTYQPLGLAILIGAAGFILKEVRALNPANYVTKEEIAVAKAAKTVEVATEEVATEETEEVTEAEETVAETAEEVEAVAEEAEAATEELEAVAEEAEEVAEESEKSENGVHVEKFKF